MKKTSTRLRISVGRKLNHAFFGLVALLMVISSGVANAQFTSAAQYPFTPSVKTFTYLAGGTGIPGIQFDDAQVTNIPIGFTFPFCGTNYTTVSPGSNGYVCFGNHSINTLSNSATSGIQPAVMPLFDDVSGAGGTATYLTTGTAPNRVFTIEFKNWRWNYAGSGYLTFQVKLYEGGVIECLYKQESGTPTNPSATIGIINTSTDYQTLNNSTTAPTSQTTTFTTNITNMPVDGQSYLWGEIPCTDTPNYDIVGPYQVCPNRGFALALAGTSIISGLTYQWEYSNNGHVWSNFTGTGATSGVLNDTITAPRWYRCTITCANSGISYTTPAWKVGISPFYYCYCETYMTSDAGIDIGNVTLISNQSGDTLIDYGNPLPATNNPDAKNTYTEQSYNVSPPCIYRDSVYYIGVKQINAKSSFEAAHLTVFIDFNRDGVFDTTASKGEKVVSVKMDGTKTPIQLADALFQVPNNAKIGFAGMRVILSKDTVLYPCADQNGDGEIEDYVINICHRPCDGPTNPGLAISTDTSMCNAYEYVLYDTTYERARSAFDRTWQISGDNISWFSINNSNNKDTLNRVFTGQPLYYRLRVVCPVTDDTTYSQPAFINAKPGYKCYCYSKATGGDLEDTSDIGGIVVGSYSQNDGGSHIKNPKAFRPRTDHTDEAEFEFYTDSLYAFHVFHTLKTEEHGDAKITVFVDFNNNHQYDIPDERIYTGFTSVGNHTLVDYMQIPYNVITDVPTGMRFILNNEVGPNIPSDEACGGYTSGETEDFIVVFRRRFPTTVGNVGHLDGFGVYPNPTTGKFYVQFNTPGKVNEVKISVTNVTGQKVYQQVFQHNGGNFNQQLDLANQPSGVYFVELQADGQKLIRKLVVQ